MAPRHLCLVFMYQSMFHSLNNPLMNLHPLLACADYHSMFTPSSINLCLLHEQSLINLHPLLACAGYPSMFAP